MIHDKKADKIILSLKKINEFHDRVLNDLIAMSKKMENLKADLMQNRHHTDTCLMYFEAYNEAYKSTLANRDNKLSKGE
jgi:ectoine hydroxylase-related dioxygenase (phytanoyl-CoA dioxygenase family)